MKLIQSMREVIISVLDEYYEFSNVLEYLKPKKIDEIVDFALKNYILDFKDRTIESVIYSDLDLKTYFNTIIEKNLDKFNYLSKKYSPHEILAIKLIELLEIDENIYSDEFIKYLKENLCKYTESYYWDEIECMLDLIEKKNFMLAKTDLLDNIVLGGHYVSDIADLVADYIIDRSCYSRGMECAYCGDDLDYKHMSIKCPEKKDKNTLYFCDYNCAREYIKENYCSENVKYLLK